jgi:hypothetical protein
MHDTVLELCVTVFPNKDISAAQSLAGLALPFQRKDTGKFREISLVTGDITLSQSAEFTMVASRDLHN